MMMDDGLGGFFSDFVNMPNTLLMTAGDIVQTPGFQNAAAVGANAYVSSQTGVSPQHMSALSGGRGVVGGNSQQQYWPENQRATGALQNMMGPQARYSGMGPQQRRRGGGVSPVMLLGGAALLVGAIVFFKKK